MKRLVLGMGLLLAPAAPRAAAQQASLATDFNALLNFKPARRDRGADFSWGQEYRKLRGGALKRGGRISLSDSFVRAETAYVPKKAGDPGDYRLITELGVETPIFKNGFGLKASWRDQFDSRPGILEVRDEKVWLAALSLRFGR